MNKSHIWASGNLLSELCNYYYILHIPILSVWLCVCWAQGWAVQKWPNWYRDGYWLADSCEAKESWDQMDRDPDPYWKLHVLLRWHNVSYAWVHSAMYRRWWMCLRSARVERMHSPPQGATRRRCDLLPNFSGHLFKS